MRQSTWARIALFCYGINSACLFLSALMKWWNPLVLHLVCIMWISYWFETTYFDAKEKESKQDDEL